MHLFNFLFFLLSELRKHQALQCCAAEPVHHWSSWWQVCAVVLGRCLSPCQQKIQHQSAALFLCTVFLCNFVATVATLATFCKQNEFFLAVFLKKWPITEEKQCKVCSHSLAQRFCQVNTQSLIVLVCGLGKYDFYFVRNSAKVNLSGL